MRGVILVCVTAIGAGFGGRAPSAHAQHLHELAYVAALSGDSEFPPTGSNAVGFAQVQIDLVFFTMRVKVSVQGLSGAVTEAHIHGITEEPLFGYAGAITQVPTLPSFPAGVTSLTYDQTFSLALESNYSPDFILSSGGTVSSASQSLFAGLAAGKTYLDIHTTAFEGGEIRGFLLPVPLADFDFDGVVAASDLGVLKESFAIEHHGDATGDGLTNGDDFLVWQRQLGAVASLGGHGHGHATAAPETRSFVLAAIAAMTAFGIDRRRSR